MFKGKDELVKTADLRLPQSAENIDIKRCILKQYKTLKRGIDYNILFEAAIEETTRNFTLNPN